ncbi:MAG: hypothetical protein AABX07_03105 [Nanoarchaeota archaeon]
METKQIWVLVIGALAIALVTSVISANITGNVIKVKLDSSKKAPQVYTTAEVDAKLKNFATNQGILNMLSNCVQVEPDQSENRWCGATCKAQGKKTIGFSTYTSYVALKQDGQRDLHQVSLFGWGDNQPMPSCGDETNIGCGLAGNAEEIMEIETGFNATTTTIDKVGVYSRCICC